VIGDGTPCAYGEAGGGMALFLDSGLIVIRVARRPPPDRDAPMRFSTP